MKFKKKKRKKNVTVATGSGSTSTSTSTSSLGIAGKNGDEDDNLGGSKKRRRMLLPFDDRRLVRGGNIIKDKIRQNTPTFDYDGDDRWSFIILNPANQIKSNHKTSNQWSFTDGILKN